MKVIASSLRKGNIVEIDGKLGVIVSTENIHPGKGTPVTQMDVRRIADGVKLSLRFKTTEQVERAFVEDRKHQFMYQDGDGFHFMNMESYDQVAVPADIIGDLAAYLQPEMEVTISMHEERAGRHRAAAPRRPRSGGNRAGGERPDGLVVLQAGGPFQRRAHQRAALRHHRHQDRGDDRRRQLCRAGEGLAVLSKNPEEAPRMAAPLAFNHVGMTVPDIDRAIEWYGSVMGFQLIFRRLIEYQPHIPEVREIFGPLFNRAHQAHLLSANGVGIELFQFLDPPVAKPPDNFRYWQTGLFHLCITDPDLDELVARMVDSGGRQRTRIFTFLPGRP